MAIRFKLYTFCTLNFVIKLAFCLYFQTLAGSPSTDTSGNTNDSFIFPNRFSLHKKVGHFGAVPKGKKHLLPDTKVDQSGREIPLIIEPAFLGKGFTGFANLSHFIRCMPDQYANGNAFSRVIILCHIKAERFIHAGMVSK